MTKAEFMKSKPYELVSYTIADRIKQKRKDEELWLQGFYNLNAFSTVLANMFNKHSKAKYLDCPISHEKGEKGEKQMSEEELQKQRELFVAKLIAMQKNFELNHKDSKTS